jgi:RNA polymerase sigma-70 factor (ECF subfamily)
MEDKQIVELYWERDERAIAESDAKYGRYCVQIAMNILENAQDAEECVNDTYLRAWNAIPPSRPVKLGAFLGKITHNLSLDRYKAKKTAKRGNSLFLVSLDELSECVPDGSTGFESGFDDETEARRIGECINKFLRKQSGEVRDIFICRYFYSDSIGEICRRFGHSESKVKSLLHRTRSKLKKFLESEGIRL